MLSLSLFNAPDGDLIGDYSAQATGLQFSTNEHGFEALTAQLEVALPEAFRLYDRPGLPHVVLSDGAAGVVWEGRLEDVALTDEGVRITALGYWRALSDAPYTALWSSTRVAEWRAVLGTETAGRIPDRFEMDTNNRLYIAPRKNERYDTAGHAGEFTYETPGGGDRSITTVTFTYDFLGAATWSIALISAYRWFGGGAIEWTRTGTGILQTGTVTVSLAAARERINFALYYTGPAGNYTGETGATYLRITGLRVKTTTASTVTADAVAGALASYVNGINPTQLSASGALMVGPGVDLQDEVYEDALPADILTRLCGLGDNQTPPRLWEAGVWEGRLLHLRPRGSAGRAWVADVTRLELERSLETLRNGAYAIYRDAAGTTQRTATATASDSVTRWGLTRRAGVPTQTTSATLAGVVRDAFVDDGKTPAPRAAIRFESLYDGSGGCWPLWAARSGDTLTIRNLPPTLSTDVDRVRTFRIRRTEYDAENDVLTVEPEAALPRLEMMLARRGAGL